MSKCWWQSSFADTGSPLTALLLPSCHMMGATGVRVAPVAEHSLGKGQGRNCPKQKLPFVPLMALEGRNLKALVKNSHASTATSLEGCFKCNTCMSDLEEVKQ